MIHGLVVDSDLPLPGAPTTDIADIACRRDDTLWLDEGDHVLTIQRADGQALLRYGDLAVVSIADDGGRIRYRRLEADDEALIHVIVDHAVPRAIVAHGGVVLHAGAIVRPDGLATVVVGPSGAGKSTLAAGASRRSGIGHLADDSLRLVRHEGRIVADVAGTGARLRSDSRRGAGWADDVDEEHKQRIAVTSPLAPTAVVGVDRVVVLDPKSTAMAPRRIGVRASDALTILLSNRFGMGPPTVIDPDNDFGIVAELIGQSEVYTLHYAHDFDQLDAVVDLLIR